MVSEGSNRTLLFSRMATDVSSLLILSLQRMYHLSHTLTNQEDSMANVNNPRRCRTCPAQSSSTRGQLSLVLRIHVRRSIQCHVESMQEDMYAQRRTGKQGTTDGYYRRLRMQYLLMEQRQSRATRRVRSKYIQYSGPCASILEPFSRLCLRKQRTIGRGPFVVLLCPYKPAFVRIQQKHNLRRVFDATAQTPPMPQS